MSEPRATDKEPAARRDRSLKARRAARRKKAEREMRIVRMLASGVSVAEIAARDGLTQRRMRALVQEILARRMTETPSEFLALQVGRLNEALLVSFGAMGGGNLQAVDRVVKIVRELDRYHGFAASPPADTRRLAPPAQRLLALEAPCADAAENGAASD